MTVNKTDFIKIYVADIGGLGDTARLEQLLTAVSAERQQKIARLVCEGEKRRSLAAELLRLRVLGDLGVKPEPVRYGQFGKPYVEGAHFNLSHSGDFAVCAVSPVAVGCDIQQSSHTKMNLADRFFHPREREFVCSAESEEERQQRFCRLWSLKESFVKAVGHGFSLPFDSFCITLLETDITVEQSVDEKTYRFWECHVADGYCCAVCSPVSKEVTLLPPVFVDLSDFLC